MDLPLRISLDEIFSQLALTGLHGRSAPPSKVLFWGEGAGEISSYVAGWMAGNGIDVIVLDGANRFDPYMASTFARKALIPPESLLKRIRIARAFTCYQMTTLVEERLVSFVGTIHAMSAGRQESPLQKPWVILLGLVTPFLDEDVPEREVRPLFERSLRKVEEMALEGIPFFLFQPNPPNPPLVNPVRKDVVATRNRGVLYPALSARKLKAHHGSSPPSKVGLSNRIKGREEGLMNPKRAYLTRRLFQFSNLVWRICLDDEGLKMIPEKRIEASPVLVKSTKFQAPNSK